MNYIGSCIPWNYIKETTTVIKDVHIIIKFLSLHIDICVIQFQNF